MKQITVRGIDPALSDAVQRLAERDGVSLNKAALKLLRQGAGLPQLTPTSVVGNSLDHFFGTWTAEDVAIMNEAEKYMDRVDEDAWQ